MSAIPTKMAARHPIAYLERDELEAVLAAIDRSDTGGLRDYALFALIYNCGNRIQETLNLNACDLHLSKPYFVALHGKGNKDRISPLWPETASVLRDLLARRGIDLTSSAPVFVNQRGERLGRDGAAHRLQRSRDLLKNLALVGCHGGLREARKATFRLITYLEELTKTDA